ncbi:MAG: hypothetical protein IT209_07170 [Armatimonadetes bacterium]|nr:hypothetical protein [Armatimonadota bacterium]
MLRALLASLVLALAASFSTADIVVPGADGSDGAFNPTGTSYVVDLSLASTGQWDSAPTVAGNGVYDPEKWAVVFKYSSVNVPAGCTVTFKNHPSRAPVVWLVNGTVSIAGTVSLNGKSGLSNGTLVEPGPGGFRGGFGPQAGLGSSPGFGPGGGNSYNPGYYDYANGSYAVAGSRYPASVIAVTYGDPLVSQLIGGSGGAGKAGGTVGTVGSGGSGGGALLIAASGFVSVAGQLTADAIISYGSYAAGGAIKIVADAIDIAGKISAVGADGL